YDGNGNMATQVDQLGRTTTFVNDALGRVLQTTNAAGGVATVLFNGAGLPTSQTDELHHVSNNTYNTRGEVTKSIEAAGTSVQRSYLSQYNTAGEQTGQRNANGHWAYTAYNADGDPYLFTDALNGQKKSLLNAAGEAYRQLDELGRPTD